MHWSHSYGTGMWIGMVGGTLLGWLLLVGLGYLVIRALLDARTPITADPVVLLDQRLARGEIDIDDYQRRRALLPQQPVAQPSEPDEPGHG
jgi:putative membrane protein